MEENNCIYLVHCCDSTDAPAVSSDCGMNDLVVKAWRGTTLGNPIGPPSEPEVVPVKACEE
jgi:hypothetical protein